MAVNVPDDFRGPGRGPELTSWIHSHELFFHDSHHGFSMDNGAIVGARTENASVIFHGLQVIQIVPEVELICRELLFSSGAFSLEPAIGRFPQLAYAYLRRAMSNEKIGRNADAILDYKRYISIATDRDALAYASRCLALLES